MANTTSSLLRDSPHHVDHDPTASSDSLVFAYSAFPRADSFFGKDDSFKDISLRIRDYIDRFVDTASRTIVAMIDSTDDHAEGTCCIFNPVGGGAFLRDIGNEALKKLILALIPCFLSAAYTRACRLRPERRVILLAVGAKAAESAPGMPWGSAVRLPADDQLTMLPVAVWLQHLREDLGSEHFATATSEPRRFTLPPGMGAASGDMLAIARRLRAQPQWRGWTCALTMAADEARIGNAFLSLSKYHGASIEKADPYNGACRASDENTTRRTTLLEVALAMGVLGLDELSASAATSVLPSAAACEDLFLGKALLSRHVPWDDRNELVACYGAINLDNCLDHIDRVRESQETARQVLQTLESCLTSDEWRLPPYERKQGTTSASTPVPGSMGGSGHDSIPPLDDVPAYRKWTILGKDDKPSNSVNRLGLFGFNFYRALTVLQKKGALQVLQESRLRWGGELTRGKWVITVRAEEVLGHDDCSVNRDDWVVVGAPGRFWTSMVGVAQTAEASNVSQPDASTKRKQAQEREPAPTSPPAAKQPRLETSPPGMEEPRLEPAPQGMDEAALNVQVAADADPAAGA